ncbi:N-acyl amino acid synthase FeeM domain-containing protein [Aeoliella mucimassa]|uniref:N-acetyltransferase domain-containing protein n=1 Tax=Aeoliella mucimassa TaxID=2527972 RepID=A0A518AJY8_9BACT|nr:hypothetical protein [Aeoliella mucimassa]QDU55038.1 hypothetical protein Pan181_12240 [Aeoliella mucimassa]
MSGTFPNADLRRADRSSQPRYAFRLASTEEEIAQLQQLLYRTFVLEVPRYADPGSDRLVDKFHDQNLYFIALRNDRVCGMLATHDQPPYSFADAVDDPAIVDQLSLPLWEARILAVEPSERYGFVFAGLACLAFTHALQEGCKHIAITGLATRQRMYERMGFAAIGPPVLRGKEHFVPMAIELSRIPAHVCRDLERWQKRH